MTDDPDDTTTTTTEGAFAAAEEAHDLEHATKMVAKVTEEMRVLMQVLKLNWEANRAALQEAKNAKVDGKFEDEELKLRTEFLKRRHRGSRAAIRPPPRRRRWR